jgi:hypothetical protein
MKGAARSPSFTVAPPTDDVQGAGRAKPLDPTRFAAAKFAFLEAVSDDAELPKLAARLAIKLATKYMRAEIGGEAWPSIRTLCADLSVSADSAIRKALSALATRGHLDAEPVAGGTTRYRIAARYFFGAQPVQEVDTPSQKEEGSEATPPIFEAGTPVSFEAGTPPKNEAGTPPIFEATITGHRNPVIETRTMKSGQRDSVPSLFPDQKLMDAQERKTSRGKSQARAEPCPPGFDEFWRTYPKRVGKEAARRAFARAVKAGTQPEEITLGAARYAAARDREPDLLVRDRFTAHAARWLNEGRWADEAAPTPDPQLNSTQAERPRQRPSALDLALRGRIDL